jgi:hypothetical protein
MAKLDPPFCPVALEIRSAIDERRIADAQRIAVKHLREGYNSQPFCDAVAELLVFLEPKPKKQSGKRGAPKKAAPRFWYEIGTDYERLRERHSYEKALDELADKYNCSTKTISNALRFFRRADAL